MTEKYDTQKVAELNDHFRRTFQGGEVMMTAGVAALQEDTRNRVIEAIRTFEAFTPDNDPYGEHDFINVQVDGLTCFGKIDYYDENLEYGSERPDIAEQTRRVLTIMLAEEY